MHKMVQQFLLQFRLMKVIRKMLQISHQMCKRCKLSKRCRLCPKPQIALKRSPSEEADLPVLETRPHISLA